MGWFSGRWGRRNNGSKDGVIVLLRSTVVASRDGRRRLVQRGLLRGPLLLGLLLLLSGLLMRLELLLLLASLLLDRLAA